MPRITWQTEATTTYAAEVSEEDFARYTEDPEDLAELESDSTETSYSCTERYITEED